MGPLAPRGGDKAMSTKRTRELVLAFADNPTPRQLAEDAVFIFNEGDEETGAARGREVRGRAAIVEALDHFYGRAGTSRDGAGSVRRGCRPCRAERTGRGGRAPA